MAEHPESDTDVRTDSSTPAENDRMREVDLDAVVTRQTPTRTRVIQVGVLLTVLLVVGGLVFRGYRAVQPQPTATPVEAVSMDVAILSNVNYGTLTVNGKQLSNHPPVIVTFHEGMNTILISAPPFRPHTCTFDTSRQRVDGTQCIGAGSLNPPLTIGGKRAAMWIDVPLTPTDLPYEQEHTVAAAVAQALGAIVVHSTVPAHQYIATGTDTQGHVISRLTDEELQVDAMLVRLTPLASQQDLAGVEDVCTAVTLPYGPSGLADASGASGTADTVWKVATFVAPQWRFTTQTGATAATSPVDGATGAEIEVALHFDAALGWSPGGSIGFLGGGSSSTRDVMGMTQCTAGMKALSAYLTPTEPTTVAARPNGIEGCDIQLHNSSGNSTGHLIWRFGVLLAADAAAHKLMPSLPVAPQAEIDAVTKQP